MNQNPSNVARAAKGAGSLLAGVVQCIFGGILVLGFGSALLAVNAGSSIMLQLFLLVLFLFGVLLIVLGAGKCRLFSTGQRVKAVMQGKARERLSVLAQAVRKDYTGLVRDLRALAAGGIFPGAYVDLNRREFVVMPGGPQQPIVPGDTQLRETRKPSLLPIYAVALVWVVYAVMLPLYRLPDFIVAAVLSAVAYMLVRRIAPERVIITEVKRKVEPVRPPEKINTGDEELDEVLTTAMQYMNELTALDIAITNERIDKQVRELVHICQQIFDYIRKTPSKVRQIRQFMNYYLPTTINLLKNYDELSRQPVKGENIHAAMAKIEESIHLIHRAFEKELDDLYKDKAMDISVDIEVLQSMLEQEGLTDTPIQPGAPGAKPE